MLQRKSATVASWIWPGASRRAEPVTCKIKDLYVSLAWLGRKGSWLRRLVDVGVTIPSGSGGSGCVIRGSAALGPGLERGVALGTAPAWSGYDAIFRKYGVGLVHAGGADV